MRKLLLALLVIIILGSLTLFFWARAVFTQDAVRTALAAQLSEALGQPVSVGSISASIYPRVTVKLGTVAIGEPARIDIASLDVGTDFRALLSRRIEHASARVDSAKIQLPLIPLGRTSRAAEPPGTAEGIGAPVELVSIDEIVLSNVELISAGRTLRGDVEAVPEAGGLTLRRVSLTAEDASIEASGRITDLRGPTGELTIAAGELNLDRLIGFLSDFAGGATSSGAGGGATPNLKVAITATRATLAGISLEGLSGRAQVTDEAMLLQPIAFATFGGKYDGSLSFDPAASGGTPSFAVKGAVTGIDLPAVTRFAGSQTEPITGRLSAQFDLTGSGVAAAAAMRSMRGTAHVTIQDGIVRNLGLVRAVVVATSMRGAAATIEGAGAAASKEASTSRDEPFKFIRATLAIAGQDATTNDLQFEGTNVSVAARGSIALNGSDVNLAGRVQLSDELTAQAGTDLVRVTRENGRVTLPVSISGPINAISVQIDVGEVMKRAIRNRAEDEVNKAITKGLGGLLKKPK